MLFKNLSLFILIFSFTYCTAEMGCPIDRILCKKCIETCPKNQILVKSECGCCYDQCVPIEKCPYPKLECFVCEWSCSANETMVLSQCGCCCNKCLPNPGNTTTEPVCSPDICTLVKCAPPSTCPCGEIIVQGGGFCGCCPGCVKPKRGDRCYKEVNTDNLTCGPELRCHHGVCL